VHLDSAAILLHCVQSYTPAKIRRRFDTSKQNCHTWSNQKPTP